MSRYDHSTVEYTDKIKDLTDSVNRVGNYLSGDNSPYDDVQKLKAITQNIKLTKDTGLAKGIPTGTTTLRSVVETGVYYINSTEALALTDKPPELTGAFILVNYPTIASTSVKQEVHMFATGIAGSYVGYRWFSASSVSSWWTYENTLGSQAKADKALADGKTYTDSSVNSALQAIQNSAQMYKLTADDGKPIDASAMATPPTSVASLTKTGIYYFTAAFGNTMPDTPCTGQPFWLVVLQHVTDNSISQSVTANTTAVERVVADRIITTQGVPSRWEYRAKASNFFFSGTNSSRITLVTTQQNMIPINKFIDNPGNLALSAVNPAINIPEDGMYQIFATMNVNGIMKEVYYVNEISMLVNEELHIATLGMVKTRDNANTQFALAGSGLFYFKKGDKIKLRAYCNNTGTNPYLDPDKLFVSVGKVADVSLFK
ncbi:hypothetical protein [Listeria phage LMTA-57]|uniref:Uncharacterized protein n=3 Tax=Pecentumvirus TaxID=1857844 RepID=A0A060AGK4_9CAUD|nr:hypothetical protein HH39_gp142 [Listeria phage LMSP-25]YP_009616234.1 hypothetical protein FDI77_gp142 [Listeria phage LMTA-34]YP_009793411.1 hypothetical protein QLX42_gp108 [Listeria phage LMTA-57]AIA64474.1 hypothetical protein [Listeria phage LMSP-25]AID17032.1 hypothetical protein [Listeria phage LMTA-34]AID17562.1 hypothetical protein [Listeria phage LMTA-57]